MSVVTAEEILAQVNQLPTAERGKLLTKLTREARRKPFVFHSKVICANTPYVSRKLEYEWLKKNESQYSGQWIALKEDVLLAHGGNAKEVFAKARELGVNDALVLLAEGSNWPYMGL
ncbi:MAG: DUF5678 domain-containing protein [Blastocatellia bacterium]